MFSNDRTRSASRGAAPADGPTVFRGSRWKAFGYVIFLLVLLGLGGLMLADPGTARSGAGGHVLAGLTLVVIALALLPPWSFAVVVPMRLELDRSGFTFTRAPFRPKRVEWRDVAMIDAIRFRGVSRIVWQTIIPSPARRIVRTLFGHDGGLPAGWRDGAPAIAEAMLTRWSVAHHPA